MKQYEILWVPVDKDSSPKSTRLETECGTLDAVENSVVMSIQELDDLWFAAKEYGSDVAAAVRAGDQSKIKSPGFFEYLKSKGINL